MLKQILPLLLICGLLMFTHAAGAGVRVTDKGWAIELNPSDVLILSYPRLDQAGKLTGPTQVAVNGTVATASYPGGTQLEATTREDGSIRLHFTGIGGDIKAMRMDLPIPMTLAGKAQWSADGGQPQTLPAEYPGKPFLLQGSVKRFTLHTPDGKQASITMPYGFQQLQDEREWKTERFLWFTRMDMPGGGAPEAFLSFQIEAGDAGDAPAAPPSPPAADSQQAVPQAAFKLTEKGLAIEAGVGGTFDLSFPRLTGTSAEGARTNLIDPATLEVTYADSAAVRLTLKDARTAAIDWLKVTGSGKRMRLETRVPINFGGTGKYAIGKGEFQTFPIDKPEKPFLYQGSEDTITVVHPSGAGFRLVVPPHSFQQLQDNREWNWATFGWFAETPLPPNNPTPSFVIRLQDVASTPTAVVKLIDRFGQHMAKEFEGKVTSEEELRQDVERDEAYYASLQPPQTDRFGGLPGSGEKYGLKKTGFFHVEKVNDTHVLVNPDGNIFFQLGMCGISPVDDYTTVRGREAIYEWLPPVNDPLFGSAWRPNDSGVFSFYLANVVRKYGKPWDPHEHVTRWIDRLRAWGFNSAGAFSFSNDVLPTVASRGFPDCRFLPLRDVAPSLPVKSVWDPFADGIEERMDQAFAKGVAPQANDPLIIGWFITNEPLLEDVPKVLPKLKASQYAAKRRLVEFLQEKYATIQAFNQAWGTSAADFEQLKEMQLDIATKAASEDMDAFFRLFLERRYSLVDKYFRKHNPNHLLIGDRWMPGTASSEALVSIAGKYLDLISVNYYAYGVDKAFLNRVHTWSGGKPLLLSEFHYASRDQGLTGGVRQVRDQLERGLAYRNYVEQAAATGFVVGIQWFIALDQAATGRFFEGFNGEAANTGLVNVTDRPYKQFLAEVIKTNYDLYPVLLKQREPFQFDDARFTFARGGTAKGVQVPRMVKPFTADGSRAEWPALPPTQIGADGLVLGEDASNFEATFRLAWDDQNLYVYVEVRDPTPMVNTAPDERVWRDDCIELFTGFENLNEGGSLQFGDRQILIRGAKAEGEQSNVVVQNAPSPIRGGAVTSVTPAIDGTGYVVEAAIPLTMLGFQPKAGQEILFDMAVDDATNGRRQIVWNGTSSNSKDRGRWGRAEFTN